MTSQSSPREDGARSERAAELAEAARHDALAKRMSLLVAKLDRDALYYASNGYVRATPAPPAREARPRPLVLREHRLRPRDAGAAPARAQRPPHQLLRPAAPASLA